MWKVWVGIAALLLVTAGYSQDTPAQTPLGDVARKQTPASRKAHRVLDNVGSPNQQDPSASQEPKASNESGAGRSPVLDSPADTAPDVFVVPAGTEIRVSIPDSKVVVPVRVGFATPIPALSHVSLESSLDCDNIAYHSGYTRQHCVRTYWISAVTIDGKTYDIDTDSIDTDSKVAVMQEVTFLLARPLKIPR